MYTEINKAHILFDKFENKSKYLNGIINLSEALLIISDVLSTSEDNGLKTKAYNLGLTIKNFIVNRIKTLDLNPTSYTHEVLEYWSLVLQEIIDSNINKDEEIVSLQKDINKCREKARWESLSKKEQEKEIILLLKDLPKEEIEKLRNLLRNKGNTNS
jgi:hypothetical protein